MSDDHFKANERSRKKDGRKNTPEEEMWCIRFTSLAMMLYTVCASEVNQVQEQAEKRAEEKNEIHAEMKTTVLLCY